MKQRSWVDALVQHGLVHFAQVAGFMYHIGKVYDYDFSDFQQALEYYRKAESLSPKNLRYRLARGSLVSQVFPNDVEALRAVVDAVAVPVMQSVGRVGPRSQ